MFFFLREINCFIILIMFIRFYRYMVIFFYLMIFFIINLCIMCYDGGIYLGNIYFILYNVLMR